MCAARQGQRWDDRGATVGLELQPWLWETLPFYLVLAMAAVGLAAALYTGGAKQYRRRERKLLALVEERTSALRESERQFRRSRDELEVRIHERTIELMRESRLGSGD